MTFKKLIFTQIFISAILASPAPQVGGLGFGVLGGGGGGSSRSGHGHRGGSNQEATTGLLNGGIGAANGLIKLGSADEVRVEDHVIEVPASPEPQPDEGKHEHEHEHELEFDPEFEHEFADARISHSHFIPEDELFALRHHTPEELLFEEEVLLHEKPEHFHEEINIEERPSEPTIVQPKSESFGFNSFMPDFAKSFFADESA